MKDAMQAFLEAARAPKHNLPSTSRYYSVGTAHINGLDGEPILYLKRRFIPSPDYYLRQQTHQVKEGERLDNITAHYINDPEKFWQIADANSAMKPEELTEESGKILHIPQGFGITGI
ncbi:MAG TPA: hypothetical protein VGK46_08220 [Saprospiraceae bacterium]|jgi:hypothetical protein